VVDDLIRLPTPAMRVTASGIQGEVLYVDHFGNAITSIGRLVWEGSLLHLDPVFVDAESRVVNASRVVVKVAGKEVGPIRRTYGEVEKGEVLALVGSEGMLELAANQGRGADALSVAVGDPVEILVS
jgi:hypothetical protein